MTAEAMADEGLEIRAAENAAEAVAILERHASSLRLMFTDINMPGAMDGLALARHVRLRWPSIALLVMSGKRCPGHVEMPDGARFPSKPYDLDVMLRQIRALAVEAADTP